MVTNISMKLCEQISKAGINISPYAKNPTTGAGFLVSTFSKKEIKLWANDRINYKISTSKKDKQVVISVTEKRRTVSVIRNYRKFTIHNPYKDRGESDSAYKERIESNASKFSPFIGLAKNIKTELITPIKDIKIDQKNSKDPTTSTDSWKIRFKHTQYFPAQTNNILMGMDETGHFICMLPGKVDTVKEAHEMLRPKGLTNKSVRQGEWFFTPCTDKELKDIKNKIKNIKSHRGRNYVKEYPLERGSKHHVGCLIRISDKKYATGFVFDTRGETSHKNLFLDSWHRVDRNTEKRVAEMAGRKTYFD